MKSFNIAQGYDDMFVDEINFLLMMENRINEVEAEINNMISK